MRFRRMMINIRNKGPYRCSKECIATRLRIFLLEIAVFLLCTGIVTIKIQDRTLDFFRMFKLFFVILLASIVTILLLDCYFRLMDAIRFLDEKNKTVPKDIEDEFVVTDDVFREEYHRILILNLKKMYDDGKIDEKTLSRYTKNIERKEYGILPFDKEDMDFIEARTRANLTIKGTSASMSNMDRGCRLEECYIESPHRLYDIMQKGAKLYIIFLAIYLGLEIIQGLDYLIIAGGLLVVLEAIAIPIYRKAKREIKHYCPVCGEKGEIITPKEARDELGKEYAYGYDESSHTHYKCTHCDNIWNHKKK